MADDHGKLTEIRVNGQTSFGTDFARLREFVVEYVGADTSPTSPRETGEVHLECDYALHYEHVIDALTHCSRSLDEDDNIVQLIKTIRFAPPKKQTKKSRR